MWRTRAHALEPDQVLDLGAGDEQTPALLEARRFAPG
jgi:hypothetical protein